MGTSISSNFIFITEIYFSLGSELLCTSEDLAKSVLFWAQANSKSSVYLQLLQFLQYIMIIKQREYRKVVSSNTSRLKAHAGLIEDCLLKGIFYPYVLWPFDKKLISYLVKRVRTRDYTIYRKVECSFRINFNPLAGYQPMSLRLLTIAVIRLSWGTNK